MSARRSSTETYDSSADGIHPCLLPDHLSLPFWTDANRLIRTISSGLSTPNCTSLTTRCLAAESVKRPWAAIFQDWNQGLLFKGGKRSSSKG